MLDTGVLGMLCAPEVAPELETWKMGLLTRGRKLVIPEIADYELRRELLREKSLSLGRLDELATDYDYVPITSATMRQAAELWAQLRGRGKPTADDKALDGDCILAAQAIVYSKAHGHPVIVATTNVSHLSEMVDANTWDKIT